MKGAETGVCDLEGNCLCSGEREDPDQIFENEDDDDNSEENDVGVGNLIKPHDETKYIFPRCCPTS